MATAAASKPRRQTRIAYAVLAAAMVSSFALMVASARIESVTTDEPTHLFAGYTYLTTGDFRLNSEHPPLMKELAALPLLVGPDLNVKFDERWHKAADFFFDPHAEGFLLGRDFVFAWGNDAEAIVFRGRMMAILVTLGLGFACFWYARAMYGPAAGVFAAVLILFLPTTLAHGRLVTTDVPVSTFLFIAVMCFARYLREPTTKRVLWAGIFAGLTLASKFTGLVLLPIMAVLLLIRLRRSDRPSWKRLSAGTAGVLVVAWLILWSTYGWPLTVVPSAGGKLSDRINMNVPAPFPAIADAGFSAGRYLATPAVFFKGAISMTRHAVLGHPSYLLGMQSITGWWYYFPVAILVKTPVPLLLLLIIALVFRRRGPPRHPEEYAMVVASAIYLAVGMASRADLGVRHMLPLFPFIAVAASRTVTMVDWSVIGRQRPWKSLAAPVAMAVAIVWYLFSAVSAFPNFIAYFNEPAGGPKNGSAILTDSNIDWGQDMRRIQAYLDTHNVADAFIVYPWSGDTALAHYGIKATPLPPDRRVVTAKVVISVTHLQSPDYAWLKQYPKVFITPGVVIVDVSPS